ncbi:MAG: polyphosphate kinase 2 family protein [Actinobacteria bacterium]|nr:polyphosphate kinase 2 family protein [Actinomycetota bacterium]
MLTQTLVRPGDAADLTARDPADRLGLEGKKESLPRLESLREELSALQERLYAEGDRALLLVLQGLDASGKDGAVRSVFTGVNPQGVRVVSFKVPAPNEVAHDYLWRIHTSCPARGEIGIFNRSHYEDIVTVRVLGLAPEEVWRRRAEHVRAFERLLVDEGTTVVKVFLHLSRDEQRERLQERLDDPAKRWKFRAGDLATRARWDDYAVAYEEAITETSTEWAPWHVVPADRNWVRNLAIAELLVRALRKIDPQLPQPEEALDGIVLDGP